MAKKQSTDPKTATLARIRRTEAYAEKVRLLFARTVNEILAINKTMPELDEGVMFSFDGTSAKKREQVETLLRRLHSAATLAIQKGVQAEWAQANAEADKLVQSVLGKEVLGSPQFTAYMQRNTKAMQAFIGRSEHGLNLSQRVWKPVRQLRDEMEVAMTVAIGEGESAADMSRKVRQYLNDPDLMFRRFRYKIGEKDILDEQGNVVGKEPVFGRKWKKRVIDPDTGRHKWIDYDRDSYPTGRGVYKSSAKNAMRVTRTETNIAYRRADNERWQQMDFVIGQRIQLSKNHPKPDICDKLQGEYPKDFQFDGWHPQCFCYVTPITIPPEETQRITEAFLKGEDCRAVRDEIMRGRQITDYPANFKDWVTSHAEDIAIAREQGTAPYFIANNGKAIDGILNPDQAAPATTPAQAKAYTLNQLGKAVKAGNLPQEAVDKLQHIAEHGTQEEFEHRAATLQAVAQRHAQRTPERKEFLRDWWDDRKEENRIIKLAANNIVKVANDYAGVDAAAITAVENALNGNNLDAVRNATQQLAQKVLEIKKQEQALADLIPNAHELHKSYSIKELQVAHNELDGVMKKWLNKYGYSSINTAPLEHLKNKLDFELQRPTISYSHKGIIKDAITEKIRLINNKIEWNDLVSKAATLSAFKTKSTIFKGHLTRIDEAIQKNDFAALKKGIAEAEAQRQKLIEQQIKRGGNSALNKEYKGAATGKDITASVDTAKMTSEDPYNGTYTNNVARMQGFDAPAKLVSEAEFDMLAKANGDVFYRTVNPTTFKGKKMSSKEFASQLYKADLLELNGPGGRVHGDGMYVASSAWDGRCINPLTESRMKYAYSSSICYGYGNHTISEMTWVRKPRIIKATELRDKWNRLSANQRAKFGGHMNTYGVALGYDGMYCSGVDYLVIWNRSIIAVKKQ